MKVLKFSFLGILLAFILGLASHTFIDLNQGLLLLLVVGISVVILAFLKPLRYFQHTWLSFLFYALSCASLYSLGVVTHHIHSSRELQVRHIEPFMDGNKHVISMVFLEELKSNEYSQRFYAYVDNVDTKEVKGKLLVDVPLDEERPKVGERWMSFSQIARIAPQRFLGGFNYAAYLQNKEIYGQIKLSEENGFKLREEDAWRYDFARLREKMMSHFKSVFQSEQASQLGVSLLFGDRKGLNTEVLENFKNTGVMHVLAISGLHVGILFVLLSFLFKKLPRIPKELLIVFCLWGFAFMSGLSASVFRAVLMFSIVAIARLYRRQQYSVNTVAFAMLFSLCLSPRWLYDLGFQLSYAAVFSIVFFYPVFKKYTYSNWWLVRYLKELIAVSIAAQLGVFPLLLFYFHQFPWYFLLGNMIAIPLVTLLLLCGFAVFIFSFVSQFIAGNLAYVFEKLSQILFYGVEKVSEIPMGMLDNISFHYTLVFSVGLIIVAFFSCLKDFRSQKVIMFLTALFLVQVNVVVVNYRYGRMSDLTITSDSKGVLLFVKEKGKAIVYAERCDERGYEKVFADYKREYWVDELEFRGLPLGFVHQGHEFLVVNRKEVLDIHEKQEVLLITSDTKINYERLFDETEPKFILLSSTVPKWQRELIKRSCIKKEIPFHDISEKGFYKL